MGRTFWYLIGGVALLGVGGALLAGTEEVQPGSLEDMRDRFRSYFEVASGCSSVVFKGDADEAGDFWKETGGPLVDAMVSVLAPATGDPDEISRIFLQYVFPGCPWPPPAGRLDLQALHQAVRFAVEQRGS